MAVSLARNPDIAVFARTLVRSVPEGDRVARLAMLFSFVGHLVDVPKPEDGFRDGVDWLMALAGEEEGPAVILASLLLAIGERASVEYRPGAACVSVELDRSDFSRLPPHARPFWRRHRAYLPLDVRGSRAPLGFVPRLTRQALRLR